MESYTTLQQQGRKCLNQAYLYLLELLLRLRQTADHCYLVLISSRPERKIHPGKFDWKTVIGAVQESFNSIVKEIRETGSSVDIKQLNVTQGENSVCGICSNALPSNTHTTTCGHIFCSDCILGWVEWNNKWPMCNNYGVFAENLTTGYKNEKKRKLLSRDTGTAKKARTDTMLQKITIDEKEDEDDDFLNYKFGISPAKLKQMEEEGRRKKKRT